MGINKNKYLEWDLSSSLPSLPLHLPTRPPHLSKATLLRLKLLTAASNLPSSLPVNRLSGDSDPFSRSTDPPLLDLLATPSKLTWAWPRPAPLPWRRRSSSLLLSPLPNWATLPTKCSAFPRSLTLRKRITTWPCPRPLPVSRRRRSSSLLLSQLPNWATLPTKCSALPKLPLPLPRRLSSGDPFSRSTDLPLLDLLATPSKPTWAWPRKELSRVTSESSSRRAPPSSARPSRQPSTSSSTAKPSGKALSKCSARK